MLRAWPIPVYSDNYVWVLQEGDQPQVAVVDPGDAGPVITALADRNLELTAVLVTHHHGDHVGGLPALLADHQVPVYGPEIERISGVDRPVAEGATVCLPELGLELQVMEVPGHTAGHVAYLGGDLLLSGDTLFAGGCGRVFEGTMKQMANSLGRLAAVPPGTAVYCAHEYTQSNLRFALQVEPDNPDLQQRHADVVRLRQAGTPTLPSTIGLELRTNPFLRCDQSDVVAAAEARTGRRLDRPAEVFAVVRTWKDGFRG